MIDDVNLVVGASGAGIAAGLTWAYGLPGRRRAARRTEQAKNRAEQAIAEARRQTEDALAAARAGARQQVAEARAEAAANWAQLQHLMAELEHLSEVRLPGVLQELQGVRVPVAVGLRRPDLLAGSEAAGYLEAAEDAVRAAGDVVRRKVEDSARAGLRVAAEEIQASLTRAQRDIDNGFDDHDEPPYEHEYEHEYEHRDRRGRQADPYHQDHPGGPEIPGGSGRASDRGTTSPARTLARVDHSVTLATHTVQRLRILTESWPGVQRANCTVAEIMESARGRIRQSDAVDYTYLAQTGEAVVEGLIVEPVIVALTELLDNAASYSGSVVVTHVQRVPNGMRVTVEDQGLGMSPTQLREAEEALASGTTDVTGLAEPGKLGFLVIGRLTHAYGLRVGLAPSASGGVRADLLIPAEHLVADEPEAGPAEERWENGQIVSREAVPPRARVPFPVSASAAPLPAAEGGRQLPWPATESEEPAAANPVIPDAADGDVAFGTAPTATAAELTAHGLPKRQPRKPVRRAPAPVQQAVSDPAALVEGFDRLRGVLAAGYADDDNADHDNANEG